MPHPCRPVAVHSSLKSPKTVQDPEFSSTMSDNDLVAPLIFAAFLVGMSGIFSGLNLGLMSFTEEDLRVVIEGSDDPADVANAKRIRPLRKRGNLLLCTLLLGNTLVNAVIAILLSDIADGIVGGVVTTALIVVFGEIMPQSICTRHALAVGARAVPLVWVFVAICFPAAYPISLLLDWLLGREVGDILTKRMLLTKLRIEIETHADAVQKQEKDVKAPDVIVDTEHVKLVAGALTFADKALEEVMTPLRAALCLPEDAILDRATLTEVLEQGHTRVPVYRGDKGREHIVALLYSKDLVGVGFERKLPLKQVLDTFNAYKRVHYFSKDTPCGAAFARCKRDRLHLMVVVEKMSKSPSDNSVNDSKTAEGSNDGNNGGDSSPEIHVRQNANRGASGQGVLAASAASDAPTEVRAQRNMLARGHVPIAVGIASVEDIIEEMLGEHLVDDDDMWDDIAERGKQWRNPTRVV